MIRFPRDGISAVLTKFVSHIHARQFADATIAVADPKN